jgi:MATE family multidrug resistance protein
LLYTFRLGGPLALGELGWMSTYIVDALMLGRLHSPIAIAASSLGNTIYYAIVFCAIYLMNGLETLIAQAYGRFDTEECVQLLGQSLWFILLGTPLVMLATLGSLHLLPFFGTPPDIIAETTRYLHPLVWSTAPLMAYMALRRFLQSLDNVFWVTLSLITASVVNWLGDYTFLFGHFGAHRMGVAGSAWGTVLVRVYMLLLLSIGTFVSARRLSLPFRWTMLRPSPARLRILFRIGWPSGLEQLAELGVSTCQSILCARLGAVLLAAQQVVLDLNAFVYQVPAGLSYATIVRTGQAAGRDSQPEVRRAANASLLLGLGFMAVAGTVFAGFSHLWASLYSNSPEVVDASQPIFTICAFLLLTDTAFVILASALTGLGDTRSPMIVSLLSNWGFGMSLAYLLTFHFHQSLAGLWIGRAAGSALSALVLIVVWRVRLRRTSRMHISLNLLDPLHVSVGRSLVQSEVH